MITAAIARLQGQLKDIAKELGHMGERFERVLMDARKSAADGAKLPRGQLGNTVEEQQLAALRLIREEHKVGIAAHYDIDAAKTKVELADIIRNHIKRAVEKLMVGNKLRGKPWLPPTRLSILVSLARMRGGTTNDLVYHAEEAITGNRQTIRKALAELQKVGLVKSTGAYGTFWQLTNAGMAVVGGDLSHYFPTYARACAALSSEERAQLARSLQLVTRPAATGSPPKVHIAPEVDILADMGRTEWSTHPGKSTWTTPQRAILNPNEAASLVRLADFPDGQARVSTLHGLGFEIAMINRMAQDSFGWVERVVQGSPGKLSVIVQITDQGRAVVAKLTTDPIHSRAVQFVADVARLDMADARAWARLQDKLAMHVAMFPD